MTAPSIRERIWWTTYVRLYDVPKWEAVGWVDTGGLRGTNHGDYSTIMEWTKPGEPTYPARDE